MKSLLLLSGKAGSGKSYLSSILEKNNWGVFAFADFLKERVSLETGIDIKYFSSQEGKASIYKNNITYRDILIEYALKYKQKDINYFTKVVLEKIKNCDKKYIVISDFRYKHEYDFLTNNLDEFICKTARIVRNNYIEIDDLSENSLNDFPLDFVITNNFENDEKLLKQVLNNF